MKTEPFGVCDLCKGPIPDGEWFTKRGPRRYCCRECRNTANSRNGKPVRVAKLRAAVADGRWQNPAKLHPATSAEQSARSRLGRLREVAAGRWRNPALAPAARAKLSRPRAHADNPALHRVFEKLRAGGRIADLTGEEQDAHRAYRRRQQAELSARLTDAQRAERRKRWREQWHAAHAPPAAPPADNEP